MCSSKCSKPQTLSHINGRPVLQPNCSNRSTPLLERRNSLKKSSTKSTTTITTPLQPLSPSAASTNSPKVIRASVTTPPASPKLKSPRQPANKRGNIDPSNGLNSSLDKVNLTPRSTTKSLVTSTSVKKSKKEEV
ncbi:hypothetical protein ACH5RR_016034 [Cinchona calisaya]|uniref:Uncharacterized protein n=1 Tax=Cinchona calisaya TaxID=153742 RepID=A0ABD2ZY84_9GENT